MARSFTGIAGPRLPLAIAGFAGLGALAAVIAGAFFGSAESDEDLRAGGQALAALDEASVELTAARRTAASHRAGELALLATLHARKKLLLPRVEAAQIGLVDLEKDRVLQLEGVTGGSTLSAALPALSRALRKDQTPPYTVSDETGVWAVGPAVADGIHAVARVQLAAETGAIDRARRLVGGIGMSERASPTVLMLLAALLAALGAGAWAWFRVTSPIASALDVGREFVHGRAEVRANPEQGAREAREVALAINALIDRAERAIEKGRAERGDDLTNAVLAIERLGKGDLRESIALPGPIAQAIDRARRDLLERVTEMHHAALQLATRASEIAPAARIITDSSAEQLASLRKMASSSEESLEEIRRKAGELGVSITGLSVTAQEHRHAIQELRVSLSGLSRRVMAIRGTAEETHALAARAETIDQALAMLSRLAGQADTTNTKVRATALVGDARAALSEIGDKLAALEQEMLRAAHGLEILAQAQPEPPTMFEASVTQPFYDAAAILVRSVELTVGCLTALERTAKSTTESGDALNTAARHAVDLVPRLGAALSAIRLGTSFEEQLLERLERMKAEVEAAKRTDGLTPEGQRMLADVNEASEVARTKLTRLAHATEAAIRAMRG